MKLRPRLTFANVMSCVALFVALGGSAYAATQLKKNSVGTKQLKKNAVTTSKVKDGSLSAADIGGSVNSALNASTADNSVNLGGSPAATYRDGCPSRTKLESAARLCVTEGPVPGGKSTWFIALEECAGLGLRLPTPGEALQFGSKLGEDEEFWTDDYWSTEKAEKALYYEAKTKSVNAGAAISQTFSAYCVTTPSNS